MMKGFIVFFSNGSQVTIRASSYENDGSTVRFFAHDPELRGEAQVAEFSFRAIAGLVLNDHVANSTTGERP